MNDGYEHIGYTSQVDHRTRPTRQAVVAAREKIKEWLNPAEDEFVGPGNVADHAS